MPEQIDKAISELEAALHRALTSNDDPSRAFDQIHLALTLLSSRLKAQAMRLAELEQRVGALDGGSPTPAVPSPAAEQPAPDDRVAACPVHFNDRGNAAT